MQEADFIAFDTETATAQLSSLCQVGFVVVCNGEVTRKESIFVRPPGNDYAVRNSCLHGIDALKTKDSPEFPEVWEKIGDSFCENLLVAHNASFDLAVLRTTLAYYGLEIPDFKCECTYRMSGLNLAALCDALEIELVNHHDALADATACAIAYLKMKQGIRPDHRLIRPRSGHDFFAGHERITGDLLKPDPEHCDCNHPLFSKKVVFTGVLSSMTREDAARAVKAHGADIDTGITKRTNIVIAGSGAGPAKLKKIEQFNNQGAGIRIIGESEFLGMIMRSYIV
ncbi:MAG TPA: exonuclease domain-containing protein [Bacteroidales bacterium]|nr:exonuclease domain-containing protein [Bacteroidales bacterium]